MASDGTDRGCNCVASGNRYPHDVKGSQNQDDDSIFTLYTLETRDGEARTDGTYLDAVQCALATAGEVIHSLCGGPVHNVVEEEDYVMALGDSYAARDFSRGSFQDDQGYLYYFEGFEEGADWNSLELDEN